MPSIETNPRERSICAARHKTVRAESCGNLLSSRKPQACAKKLLAFRFCANRCAVQIPLGLYQRALKTAGLQEARRGAKRQKGALSATGQLRVAELIKLFSVEEEA